MPKMTHAQGIRLCESLQTHVGREAADAFCEACPLSKSADAARKHRWALDACRYLEANFAPDAVRAIREDCRCAPGDAVKRKLRRLYETSSDLADFCARYTQSGGGSFSAWTEDDALFAAYPECYCSCVKREPGLLPDTWCLCSVGYIKELFSFILGRAIEVQLLESVKTGGARCVFKIA